MIRSVEIKRTGSRPEAAIEVFPEMVRNDGGPAERTGILIVVHPTVEALTVEHVAAVGEPSDLFLPFEVVKANSAALRRRRFSVSSGDVGEFDGGGEQLSDYGGGDRRR